MMNVMFTIEDTSNITYDAAVLKPYSAELVYMKKHGKMQQSPLIAKWVVIDGGSLMVGSMKFFETMIDNTIAGFLP